MENESFEKALEPQPTKRKRSSILKPADKRERRDSRTVSFNDRCIYKELHQDGTCDITNLFLRQDMDMSMMDIVSPVLVTGPASANNQTLNSTMDISTISTEQASVAMSIEQGSITNNLAVNNSNNNNNNNNNDSTNNNNESMNTTSNPNNSTLCEDRMIDDTVQNVSSSPESIQSSIQTSNVHSMDISLVSQFIDTMPKVNSIDLPSVNYDTSTIYEKKMSLTVTEVSPISSLNSTLVEKSVESSSMNETVNDTSCISEATTLVGAAKDGTTMIDTCVARISDISSLHNTTLGDKSINDTFYGAFHDSNNLSFQSRASCTDTLVHNIEALNECIQKIDQESEEFRRKLDDEIERLFKFYRHIVNKDNKYEFAISIFGIRHSLWLIFNINPETYPNEKLSVKFAVNKRDKHLYPFPEFAEAVRRYTKEGRDKYLTRFVINAQKFRRFLRSIGYRKPNK